MPTLSKIDRIKNLAVFSNYHWDKSLETFKRYNLIYGWNGSGKTALSRMFDSLASGKHNLFPELEYQVTIDGTQFTSNDAITTKVRVFNCDYVDRNVKVLDGHANPIYVLGEKSQDTLNQIKKDEDALNGIPGDEAHPGRVELRRRAEKDHRLASKQLEDAFTSIAGTISAAWSSAGATRTYRKPNAKAAFEQLTDEQLLSLEALKACGQTLSQSTEPELNVLSVPVIKRHKTSFSFADALDQLGQRSKRVLATQVQNVAIDRLSDLVDISQWVEQGLELHKTHSSKSCEFCQQKLPPERLAALADHFSEADRQLKTDIDELVGFATRIQSAIDSVRAYDEAKLYKPLRAPYSQAVSALADVAFKLNESLRQLALILVDKKAQTTKALTHEIKLGGGPLVTAIENLNGVLKQHNETATNLEKAQDEARLKIERHYLSTILDGVEKKKARTAALEKEIDILDDGNPDIPGDLGITALRERIVENRAKVSSAHKSCQQLNEALRSFFGRDELAFEVETGTDGKTVGYTLRRGGEIARNVSEGEKTAIAFAHFTIQLTEQEFSIKEGIVVIDDPISSLDSGILYKVCAAIEKQLINAGQLFLLTHNMDFFNHMKKWFQNEQKISGTDDEAGPHYRFLMIQNRHDVATARRMALIADLDPMLRDHESEYHYLFKKLSSFEQDNPESEALSLRVIYDYPNLARKLLECFLAYRVPLKGSLYKRLHGLKDVNDDIAGEDIKYVYNFVNSHSHLDTKTGLLQFDPTIAISGRDAIKKTLGLIESADKHHYKAMSKAVKKSS